MDNIVVHIPFLQIGRNKNVEIVEKFSFIFITCRLKLSFKQTKVTTCKSLAFPAISFDPSMLLALAGRRYCRSKLHVVVLYSISFVVT